MREEDQPLFEAGEVAAVDKDQPVLAVGWVGFRGEEDHLLTLLPPLLLILLLTLLPSLDQFIVEE